MNQCHTTVRRLLEAIASETRQGANREVTGGRERRLGVCLDSCRTTERPIQPSTVKRACDLVPSGLGEDSAARA